VPSSSSIGVMPKARR